ncbi:3-ketoacyl-ACP reductase [Paenibacillus thiaminolyticus]|uniref:3-ketoacyl-ACP reductase n=1 Tax=Paenibacillus thiaminolyticus TaxID=49283 RepID=A0AAP9DXH6_PANTH|nr:3-ketoacyl-ACP reductase [Paenibacillus thiaminolyticus]MCY9535286.1 3-ketoacyl-ACP reductase [Paenibacillus thiaminolyticus]MCY9602547.1 3-ketoacyl-ACP reductase [Paenibacillus thiaminolyticus]MCY9606199.1 3-ketoacyl-ACP reductase [Paenibacillus thiaminolyticus]MCY9612584.1 3-ketoacyl-ACP reductase [Paenibacillus thiaminolyticus]MCY9620787.1 3-ketoacyl-ACP reductase [Paenibacillus thiaminolyticus]
MELNNLANKTALITGAGKGIGKALAVALAKEGTHLGLIARTQSDLESLKAELDGQYDVKVAIAAADVGLQAEVDHAVASIQEQLGPIHIVINNAGIASFGTLADMPVQEWERIIQVNLMGTYYVTRAVLPGLIAQNEGSIINISSTAGERGFATGSAYNASKFAVMGLTEALMQEVRKHNIRVTALTPSTVNTELAVNAGLKIGEEDRMMQPEDVAELALAALKLPQRVFVKTAGIWTTNPQ